MISTQKKFLFIHVPKTGGNSIQSVMRRYSEDEIVTSSDHQDGVERFEVSSKKKNISKHSTLTQYKFALNAEVYNSLFKFATIRNPWDMMISFYFSPHRKTIAWNRADFLSLLETVPTLRYYICERSLLGKGLKKIGLEKLIKARSLDGDIDFLIRFEHLEEDFELVCERLKIPHSNLPKRNASRRNHYSTYYDDELKEVVHSKFLEEIEFGGYHFEEI